VELSFDHKCSRPDERARIVAAGGQVIRDRLHGVLAVSRAFGDAEHKRLRGVEMWGREFSADPLTAEPEIVTRRLGRAREREKAGGGGGGGGDEFVVLACDGIWDVMTSQQAVNFVRRRLLAHRDARRAAQELVDKALELTSIDNCSAIVVAFEDPSVTVEMQAPAPAPAPALAVAPALASKVAASRRKDSFSDSSDEDRPPPGPKVSKYAGLFKRPPTPSAES
jgi:protein phosphatase 2C family protein 2/3